MSVPGSVWLYGDIIAIVFDQLDAADDHNKHITYAQCALVCREWAEPASEALWQTMQYSLVPLYRILHSQSKRLPLHTRDYNALSVYVKKILHKEPYKEPLTWSRFLRCAARICFISDWVQTSAELALIRALHKRNGGVSFLPSLRSFSWQEISTAGRDVLPLLVTPSLTRLEYTICQGPTWYSEQVRDTLACLASAAPRLSTITVSLSGRKLPFPFDPWKPFIHPAPPVMSFLSGFNHLQQVVFVTPQQEAHFTVASLKEFSSLPVLEVLQARIDVCSPSGEPVHAPRLRVLRTVHSTRESVRDLLVHLHAPHVRELEVQVSADTCFDTDVHYEFFKSISRASFSASLRVLRFAITRSSQPLTSSSLPLVLTDIVHPLFSLAQLRIVSLAYQWPVILSDEQMEMMAVAWHDIEELEVKLEGWELSENRYPTPLSLCHFARLCPHLVRLGIPLDLESNPIVSDAFMTSGSGSSSGLGLGATSELEAFSLYGHPLRVLELTVGKWQITDSRRGDLVEMLDEVFPRLDLEACRRFRPRRAEGRKQELMELVWDEVEMLRSQRRDTGR